MTGLAGERAASLAKNLIPRTHIIMHAKAPNFNDHVARALSSPPKISACTLRPHRRSPLFVAWNGVMALVYEGFPRSLTEAKRRLAAMSLPGIGGEESFGSKWPKTTLAAVEDDSPDITPDQLGRLQSICEEHSERIHECNFVVKVETLSVVEYECRSLERLVGRRDISLAVPGSDMADIVDVEEKATADGVVDEWSDLESYLPKVNAPGSRIGSYRNDDSHGGSGSTCVAFLRESMPEEMMRRLSEFEESVEREFPGRYSWLDKSSLHCTLRSLDRDET